MSFFESFERRPRDAEQQPEEYRQPEWAGPTPGVLGGPVAERVVLHHSPDLAIAVVGLVAFPNGVQLTLLFLGRDRRFDRMMHLAMHSRFAPESGDVSGDLFRFGVAFSDGRKASTLALPDFDSNEPPAHPVLAPRGGGGGGNQWSYGYWLWPLPPAGDLTFVCEWPAQGIAETRGSIDTAAIRAAADQALVLWDA